MALGYHFVVVDDDEKVNKAEVSSCFHFHF